LVEDDESVRLLIRRTLEKSGFRVLEAEDGKHAILVSDEYDGTIDLLLTDVQMPRMSGWQVAERVRGRRAGIKVLYMSGYSEAAIKRMGDYEAGATLITKTFTMAELVTVIRGHLVGPHSGLKGDTRAV
jgi:DNA-binding response OmpR family regulator